MNPSDRIDLDARLHAYVDDRLDPTARAQLEAWLREHPEEAARAEAWRRDNAALRTAWAWTETMPVEATLDPARLRRRRVMRRRRGLGMAAACVLALGLGGWGGWQLRDARLLAERPPMADAVAAYRLFATTDAGLEYLEPANDDARLREWLASHFHGSIVLPDLRAQGLSPRGGRLLSTPEGAAAMLVYEDASGGRVALYLRPLNPRMGDGERRDGMLLARYWSQGTTSFALVGPAGPAAPWRAAVPEMRTQG